MKNEAIIYLKLLVEKARENGLEPIDTFIQKGMYFLSDALGANLDIRFEAYLYGPYSKEVNNLIDYLHEQEDGLLDTNTVNIEPEIVNRVEHVISIFKKAEKKFTKYADFKARLWELLGTTDYVMRYVRFTSNPETEDGIEKIARAAHRWKDYFSEDEIKEAARFLHVELVK